MSAPETTISQPDKGWAEFAATYGPAARRELTETILPFWQRTLDHKHGGVLNCWSNAGTQLVSRDKFTWSQGRFAWMWSRLAGLAARRMIPGDVAELLAHAEKTVRFLERHAFLPDGRCALLLSDSGEVKEVAPGAGPAPSIYADCFVLMGFAEFARVSGDRAALDRAWDILASIETRIAAGPVPAHPHPVPEGYEAYAVAMIHLNLTLVLHEACTDLGDTRLDRARERSVAAAARIFDCFMETDGRIAEFRRSDGGTDDSVISRHLNPGHALEGLWMLLTVAEREGRADWRARALKAVEFALERGWDEAHGGMLYYVDRDGGVPRGTPGPSTYERSLTANWDAKIWWVHSETIYATALSYRLTAEPRMRVWFERVWEYSLRTFPQPDRAVGEWIQIRNRHGEPLERVVALPVKDPYHITRNLMQVLELATV